MRFPCSALVAALVLAAPGAGASAAGGLPDDLIRGCLEDLRAVSGERPEKGPYDLRERCPALADRLAAWPEAADAMAIHATSIAGLEDLRSFAAGSRRAPSPDRGFSPDYDGLEALVAEVLIVDETEDDIWERFQRWLRGYIQEGASPGLDRLAKWVEGLDAPPWLGDVLLKGSVILIVLLALIVVGNEIRLARVWRRGPPRGEGPVRAASGPAQGRARRASFDDLRGMPPRQLAATILEIVTAAFAERGWLAAGAGLTNGELVRQVRQCQSRLAPRFAGLVNGVETIVYGDRLPDEGARQRLLATARRLVDDARGAATAERPR